MTTIARVTRTQVAANEAMIGKKVTLLDGSIVKITDVASAYAYSHDGGRSRLSAYLLVKDGRNFKQIEQEDVDGKVTSVEDAGGYAKYAFAGSKRKPAPSTKPDPKPAPSTKPEGKRKPSTKPETKPAPSTKPEGKRKPSTKPETKPEGKRTSGNKVTRKVESHEMPDALAVIERDGLTEKSVASLRKEIADLLSERYGVGKFEGLDVTSESHFNSADSNMLVTFGFDFSPYLESPEVEVDADDASEQLLKAGIIPLRKLRNMTDDQIIAAYKEHFGDQEEEEVPAPKGNKRKAKPAPAAEEFDLEEEEFEEEQEEEFEEEEQEEHEEEEQEEIAHIALDNSLFSGVVAPKSHEGARVFNALADAWEIGAGDIFPGILLQYNKAGVAEPLEVAFIGLTVHKGSTAMLVVDTDTLEEAKPSRMIIKIDAALERCLPLVESAEDEEPNADADEYNELDDDGEFELDLED